MIICILGRQSSLAAAELESLYGPGRVRVLTDAPVALVDSDAIEHELGGSRKITRQIDVLPTTKFDTLTQHLKRRLPIYLRDMPAEGKIKLGVSVYGLDVSCAELTRTSLSLKQTLKRSGRSVRAVPNTELTLSSAQVIHNQLTSPLGLELVLVRDGANTIVARTVHEQDIEAYTLRDRGRPRRDPFVGMLPPKLAQIMIHLATIPGAAKTDTAPTLLDPFCGTGVVLQEAILAGYHPYGTDISERMIRFTRDNLNWLMETHLINALPYYEVADATTHTWRPPIDLVVCESYLGRPIGGQQITPAQLQTITDECDAIIRGFLHNIAPQLRSGTPLCIGVPAWFIDNTIHHLPCIDELEQLGYNRTAFAYAKNHDLIYRREDQAVGRELLVLTRR